ncbi:MAG: NfeD family protein [Pseudomonadota bacterium]|nr:NfeD family protein [Pseudomonadota bacterium]
MANKLLITVFLLALSLGSSKSWSICTGEMTINGAIGPATVDYLESTLEKTIDSKCASLLILINTPGGNLQSTRMIVESILSSKIPVLCLVYPSGGHAGSAGAIILQACHVSGGINPTNIGAATPILMGGEEMGKDLRNKLVNDTVSWVEGLAKLRGRNLGFAKDIVEKAQSLGATQAAGIGGIDFVVNVKEEFLEKSTGKEVLIRENLKAKVEVGSLVEIKPGLRHIILDFVADPQFAYFIFMGSVALLYFEITHPGIFAPGVIGSIGLILSLISFHKLNVWWGGLGLLFLGIVMLILEAFVPSFGVLGVGGIVAFTVGSLFLFDPVKSGYVLPLSSILPTTFLLSGVLLGLGYLVLQTRKVKKHGGFDDVIGAEAVVVSIDEVNPLQGYLEIAGENWKFQSESGLQVHQRVKVLSHKELVLKVIGL